MAMRDTTKLKFNYSLSDLGSASLPQQRRKIAALL